MKYYSINISGFALAGCQSAQEFFWLRRNNLKITAIFWIPVGVEINPFYTDCTYTMQVPVLVFIN